MYPDGFTVNIRTCFIEIGNLCSDQHDLDGFQRLSDFLRASGYHGDNCPCRETNSEKPPEKDMNPHRTDSAVSA